MSTEPTGEPTVAELMKMMIEDRRRWETELAKREAELAEERSRRDREVATERERREEELAAERKKREADNERQLQLMTEQMETMRRQLETAGTHDRSKATDTLKLTKLTEKEDIEAFLKTFERMMEAYEIDADRWAFKLAPQLTGKAQQAYASLNGDQAAQYVDVKKAILRRYNINEETYRERFRAARRKEEEGYAELALRLQDLLRKWMEGCDTVEAVCEKILVEQMLNAMPVELKIWVGERKPTSGEEAARLADNYVQARRRVGSKVQSKPVNADSRKCHTCGKVGHLARQCPDNEEPAKEEKKEKPKVTCYNCGQQGHIALQCPSKALFCGGGTGLAASCTGTVEQKRVGDILLDTGCSRTMVRRELVPNQRLLEGEAVAVRCAHGDTVLYPLANVHIQLGGVELTVKAAVAEKLPVSVLLGTDVPCLRALLQQTTQSADTQKVEEALVMTRAQARRQEEEELVMRQKEAASGAKPSPVLEEEDEEDMPLESQDGVESDGLEGEAEVDEQGGTDSAVWGDEADGAVVVGEEFSDDLFPKSREKARPRRSQRRSDRQAHGLVRAKDKTQEGIRREGPVSRERLQELQRSDVSLEGPRKAAEEHLPEEEREFSWQGGTLMRRWRPPNQGEVAEVEQVVLPQECRRSVLDIAHTIPIAGHLGRKKTTRRILQRFYWPSLYRDVADYCRSCPECQWSSRRKPGRVPMMPLPVIAEPFSRIAMDIVGPLPRSRSGNRYVLVICDYATRYPEAVALRSIDAENVAEELVRMFARVGIPQEILTDQGSNFTSQLLAEIYRLVHVKALRTSPYHPQSDGVVERFNQTLKQMLRRTANEEGKDWDRLLPYVLFAYREVPQESTGFSPFELLYGREVRGPLDVLKEGWEPHSQSDVSVVSYVVQMRDKFAEMAKLVQCNMEAAQCLQKQWYDRTARERKLKAGDQVLVLLPTSSSKLLAQWQGPYSVVRPVGKVNYLIDMHDRRRRKRVLHINMLKQWHESVSANYLAQEGSTEEDGEDTIPTWGGGGGEAVISEELSEEQRGEIRTLLASFADVFQATPGYTKLCEHRIETGDARPVRLPPYRLPHAHRETVQQELKEMLEQGIIEHSVSDWAAPIVLVGKKDGSLRLCVDYRRLNSVSRTDAYPMVRIDDLIDKLGRAKYLSTLDLTRGYWQIAMAPQDQHKTAFATPFGLFQFTRMPFGLQGAPATFQRMMDRMLDGLENEAGAYIDDLVVFSETWREHLQHLEDVLKRLQEAGLTLKPKKCHLAMAQCVYLGYMVGGGKVQVEESKVAAVEKFPTPRVKKDVRAFLGLTGYYRKFIPQYASTAAPLSDLTRKSEPDKVAWTPSCEIAFQKLKEQLCSAPVLRSPDFEKMFTVQTDASDRGVGAVLSQADGEGGDHPIAFYSRKLLPREERYATVEKECLAVKLGVEAFRVYLLGRPFVVETDHRALEWMDRMKENNMRLTRWSLFLQPYNFTVRYRPGKSNGNADALSRGV